MKSEPEVYSIDDLQRENTTIWDGVRNYQARNYLRQMQIGDTAFFYHSNCKNPAIVGLGTVIEIDIIDYTQFNDNSPYFDKKATINNPRWFTVKVQFKEKFNKIITLKRLKEMFKEDEFLLVKKGNRLSIIPVSENIAIKILNF